MLAPLRDTPRRIAFLVHYLDGSDLRYFDAAFARFGDQDNARFVERTRRLLGPFVLDTVQIRSPRGQQLEVLIIVCPFTSDQAVAALRGGSRADTETVRQAMDVAIEAGCELVGFGAYTSIVSGNCLDLPEDRIACTSGNSLTVAAAVHTLVANAADMSLPRRSLGVVGAGGNIGTTLCELAAEHVDELVLVGRSGSMRRLERLARRIQRPVRLSTELAALRECNLIAAASNAPAPVVHAEHVSQGPVVVCDLAVPSDVHVSVKHERPLARVLRGGLIRLPLGQSLGLGGVEPLPEHVYACLGETLLLGFEGVAEHYSYGNLELQKVRRIQQLAERHEFRFANRCA